MTAKETVQEKRQEFTSYEKILTFVEQNAEKFDSIGGTLRIWNIQQIDIDNPTREQVLIAIKTFPGKWNKKKQRSVMNYSTELTCGITIRLWATELPPSCHVIKREIFHETRTEVVEEIVCNVPEPIKEPVKELEEF